MTYARLCEHDKLKPHFLFDPDTGHAVAHCKGGEFLADDALELIADALEPHLPEAVQPYSLRLAQSVLDALTVREGAE